MKQKDSAGAGKAGKQDAAPGPRTEEASLRELVEGCLVNDDFTPVLRLVFAPPPPPPAKDASGNGMPGAASPDSGAAPPPSPSPASAPAKPARGKAAAAPEGPPALLEMQRVLRSLAAEQDAAVTEICAVHAMEIATCVAELDRMVAAADELKGRVTAGGEALQRAGTSLAAAARELQTLLGAQRHLGAALGGVRAVRCLLRRCGAAGRLLGARRLFAALRLLAEIRAKDLATAMQVLSGNATAAGGGGGPGVGPAGASTGSGPLPPAPIPPKHQAAVTRLRGFLQTLVSDLEAAVEYFAVAEFNSWMVGVRAESRQVGLRAIRRAAIDRQLEEDESSERRQAAAGLMSERDAAVVAARAVVPAAFRKELAEEAAAPPTAMPVTAAGVAAAAAGQNGAAERGTASGRFRAAARAAAASVTLSGSTGAGAWAGAGGPSPSPSSGGAAGTGAGGAMSAAELASLHPGNPLQAAQAVLARHLSAAAAPPPPVAVVSDATVPLLQGVDMRGLHRCVHIHRCLGRMPALRRYYLEQRRLQIRADLAPPPAFLENYQAYLARVTGFFVVEDAVRTAAPDLLPPDAAALLWEAAAGSLRGVLGAALEEALGAGSPAAIMLLLKDFMLLVCSALTNRSFATAPITELLTASRLRYLDLLTASVALRVGRALASDSLAEGARVGSEAEAAEAARLGLPAALESGAWAGAARPAPPYTAPYTPAVPRTLAAVRGFVSDVLSYLRGLLSPWELLPAVVAARDRLVAKTVVDALADHTARLLGAPAPGQAAPPAAAAAPARGGGAAPPPAAAAAPWRPREVMRCVTNAWALAAAMTALDEWTLVQVRPLGAMAAAAAAAAASGASASAGGAPPPSLLSAASGRAGPRSATAAAAAAAGGGGDVGASAAASSGAVLAALRSVQDGGERGLLRLLAGRVEALVGAARAGIPWLPPGPLPAAPSAYAEDLLALLKETFDAAASILPRSSHLFLCRALVRAMGNAFMSLMKEGVKAYNLFALEALARDVALLDGYLAAGAAGVPGLGEEFAEPRQLCALLLSPRIEEVLIPEVRRQRYFALPLAGLVVVLERYREQARVGKERTGHVSRRTVEGVAKQLRQQMVTGTAVSGLRVLEDI
ncbi:hypothetical protein HYH03_016264 [Edaphochlamys debaryana]|uniref:Uncharacterized protein n=1 Tax=Edaphochlamys debaryana TaxID=47281 RepID=A0A835XHW0_9CHLO|nr:hypothetical protein HYH03_016264 [Edaphochlamys debaryana]|eukprot:KAG2484967.1 hypothetical protein HYH03_016264 [Edaphochlamys debaryana]